MNSRMSTPEIATRLDVGRLAVYRDLLTWWPLQLTGTIKKRPEFPALVAIKRGPYALAEQPGVIVGIIYYVKGCQGDCVYLFPDLNQAGDAQYRRDSVIRLFYAGATGAREKPYICARESNMAVTI